MAVHRLESRDFPPHLGSEKTIRPLLVLSPSMIRFSFIPAFVLFVVLQTVAMVFLQHVDGMGWELVSPLLYGLFICSMAAHHLPSKTLQQQGRVD